MDGSYAAFSACERCEHQLVYHPAAEATCTQDGNVEYWSCSLCALGHSFGEWSYRTEPTCTEQGERVRTCARCGKEETREVREIGENAFTYCVSLTAVKFEGAEDWRAVREDSIGGIADEAIFSAQELALPERAAAFLTRVWSEDIWTREE